MKNETEVGEGMAGMALFGIALALVGMLMTGCSFKVETLYHGRTPIGLDHRQATSLQAAAQPAARVIKYQKEED